MDQVIAMVIVVAVGLAASTYLRRTSHTAAAELAVIVTFALARAMWGWAWRSASTIPSRAYDVSPTGHLTTLFLANFAVLSVLFILAVNWTAKRGFALLGWTRKNLMRNILIGCALGCGALLPFAATTLGRPIRYQNIPMALFFSFAVASWQEENLFRGHLLTYLRSRVSVEKAVLLQALAYSLAHLGFYPFWATGPDPVQAAFAFVGSLLLTAVLGVALGFLRAATGSQVPGFLTHGLIDTAILLAPP